MWQWKDCGDWSKATLGILEISCCCNERVYKDGSRQYMIYLRVPVADSKEIITLTKVRGQLSDAKMEAEKLFKNFKYVTEE
jgi:hypothetical protein